MSDLIYVVQKSDEGIAAFEDDKYQAVVFQGNNVFDVIPAKSEKQAHFLAWDAYPGIRCNQRIETSDDA